MSHEVFGFIDGENLVTRYEEMLKNGAKAKKDVKHIPGFLVWHPDITNRTVANFTRVSYYQTVSGDDTFIENRKEEITAVKYYFFANDMNLFHSGLENDSSGTLHPRLFKKSSKGIKTKSVDINITVDALRCVINNTGNVIHLFSGDGDYLPLIEEINRHGKQVWLSAFSSGLNKNLRYAADEFYNLDSIFFENS